MNTTENNKLIAEFLGLQLEQDQEILFISGLGTKLINETFNKDWNWLMEVVEKIENTTSTSIIISCGNCEVYNCETQETMFFFEGVKIEAVYNASLEFIKWYNENKD